MVSFNSLWDSSFKGKDCFLLLSQVVYLETLVKTPLDENIHEIHLRHMTVCLYACIYVWVLVYIVLHMARLHAKCSSVLTYHHKLKHYVKLRTPKAFLLT